MPADPTRVRAGLTVGQVPVVRLENSRLRVDVSPETGGRLISLVHKPLDREFLWTNPALSLARVPPGAPYDPNFYGGLDDILPGDLPEIIDGLACPDHGELWTLPLAASLDAGALQLEGRLPLWGLRFRKRLALRPGGDWLDLDYHLENQSRSRRVFLWKLHAAAVAVPGSHLVCPARTAAVADPHWSRWGSAAPFHWPIVQGRTAGWLPPPDGTTDFLFLYDLAEGRVGLRQPSLGCELSLAFDPAVFPYVCFFASYGGFDGHYLAVLEPATAMPLSVNAAARLGQCSVLEPGQHLATRVSIYAGPLLAHTGPSA